MKKKTRAIGHCGYVLRGKPKETYGCNSPLGSLADVRKIKGTKARVLLCMKCAEIMDGKRYENGLLKERG